MVSIHFSVTHTGMCMCRAATETGGWIDRAFG